LLVIGKGLPSTFLFSCSDAFQQLNNITKLASTNYPKIHEQTQNSRYQTGDIKQDQYTDPINIRNDRKKNRVSMVTGRPISVHPCTNTLFNVIITAVTAVYFSNPAL